VIFLCKPLLAILIKATVITQVSKLTVTRQADESTTDLTGACALLHCNTVSLTDSASRNVFLKIFEKFKGLF
jgi:hypothetical protein